MSENTKNNEIEEELTEDGNVSSLEDTMNTEDPDGKYSDDTDSEENGFYDEADESDSEENDSYDEEDEIESGDDETESEDDGADFADDENESEDNPDDDFEGGPADADVIDSAEDSGGTSDIDADEDPYADLDKENEEKSSEHTDSKEKSSESKASGKSTDGESENGKSEIQQSDSRKSEMKSRKKTKGQKNTEKSAKAAKSDKKQARKSSRRSTNAAEADLEEDEQWKPGRMTPAERAAIRSREIDPEATARAKRRFMKINARVLTYVIIIVVVIAAALGISYAISHWTYSGYRVVSSRKQEDTLSADYYAVDGKILRLSSDGASLSNRSGDLLWDVSYTMTEPEVTTCDDVIAIYDQSGTSIVVCNTSGELGMISTSLPIVKASVSEAGNVAVIQEDSDNAWIEYYSTSGTEIAAIKTSMSDPGYPLDVSVSRNGELVAVSYLSIADGTQKAVVHVYSFGSAGQNQMDNRIADFEYNSILIPQLDYLTGSTLLAFREDGFVLYSGAKTPEENTTVTVDSNILSVFHDDEHIGLILEGDNGSGYRLQVYNLNGNLTLDKEFNFVYQKVDFVADEITLYNGSNFCVFDLSGNNKFNGSYSSSQQDIFALGKHRYVVVKETSLDMIQLS